MAGVGAVLSNRTLPLALMAGAPGLPEISVKAMLKVTLPSVSAALAVYVVVQVLLSKLGLVGVFARGIAIPPDRKVIVGVCICSLVTKLRVTILLTTALVLVALLDAIEALVTVGADFSNVTLLPSSTLETAAPTIPARLVKPIVKLTKPAVSFWWAVYFAVQFLLSPLAFV